MLFLETTASRLFLAVFRRSGRVLCSKSGAPAQSPGHFLAECGELEAFSSAAVVVTPGDVKCIQEGIEWAKVPDT